MILHLHLHHLHHRHHRCSLTLPAGADCELDVDLGGVDGPVVSHQVGVKGHPVHVERHHWELHVDDVVMPLLVTDLGKRVTVRSSSIITRPEQ